MFIRVFLLLYFIFLTSGGDQSSPPWLLNLPNTAWPSLKRSSDLEPFRYLVREEWNRLMNEPSSDGEALDALEHYFWGKEIVSLSGCC